MTKTKRAETKHETRPNATESPNESRKSPNESRRWALVGYGGAAAAVVVLVAGIVIGTPAQLLAVRSWITQRLSMLSGPYKPPVAPAATVSVRLSQEQHKYIVSKKRKQNPEGNQGPIVEKIIINPPRQFRPNRKADEATFRMRTSDRGNVTSVRLLIVSDSSMNTFPMTLVSGRAKDGVWEAFVPLRLGKKGNRGYLEVKGPSGVTVVELVFD